MKTRIAKNLLAINLRPAIAGLLVFALSWSLVLPFTVRAERPVNTGKHITTEAPAPPATIQTTETFTVFGPQRFTRLTGNPVNTVQTFSLPAEAIAPFGILIENGAPEGSNRVSNATIKLNGVELYKPSDFNQNVASLTKAVTLTATNTLEVKLASAAGSYLTISFTATRNAVQPSLTSVTPVRTTQGQILTATLVGAPGAASCASTAGDGTVTLSVRATRVRPNPRTATAANPMSPLRMIFIVGASS